MTEPSSFHKPKYGAWAGAPNGMPPDSERCAQEVSDGWRVTQCSRKRGHGAERAYCRQHDPAAVKKREQARAEKYDEELQRLRVQWSAGAFLQALRLIAAGSPCAQEIAQATINEFERGPL